MWPFFWKKNLLEPIKSLEKELLLPFVHRGVLPVTVYLAARALYKYYGVSQALGARIISVSLVTGMNQDSFCESHHFTLYISTTNFGT